MNTWADIKYKNMTPERITQLNREVEEMLEVRSGKRADPPAPSKDKSKIIGLITIYNGTEHKYLIGYTVKVIGVIKNALKPGVGEEEVENLTDEDSIKRAGGVTAYDRLEVQPWIEKTGSWGFATSDPRAIDLEAFAKAKKPVGESMSDVLARLEE
jgi:hypothetical protein